MKLPENLRDQFKTPLGTLIPNDNVTKEGVLKNISDMSFIITVGDATTEKMVDFGLIPSIQIVDNQEKRIKRNPLSNKGIKTNLECSNPPAEITQESIDTIQKAIGSEAPVRITVNGEEDLLVIPVCLHAPLDSIVMYGQPNKGLVIVKVDSEIRNKSKYLLGLME